MKNSFSQSTGYKIHDVVNGQYDIEYETGNKGKAVGQIIIGVVLCITILGAIIGVWYVLFGVINLIASNKTNKLTIVKGQGVKFEGNSVPFSDISRSYLEGKHDSWENVIKVDTAGTTVCIAGPMSGAASKDIQNILHQEMAAA